MRWKVTGDRRLYIDGKWREPDEEFTAKLDNPESLIEAGHIAPVKPKKKGN